MGYRTFLTLCVAMALGLPVFVRAADAPKPVDYGQAGAWVCRPGAEAPCTTGLDAMVVSGSGQRTKQPFVAAAYAPIDCFYVYPTVSHEAGHNSDMAHSPEVVEVTRVQAGRLASRCRLFAPLYRQVTIAGLRQDLKTSDHLSLDSAYADVLAAWRWYLAHDNAGRGVVLIGHSQGTILLQRLIAEQIDGQPSQHRLVSAFLAGDPGLPIPQGAVIGGAFKHIPLCQHAAQTGCVYVWSSYLSDDPQSPRAFGRAPGGGLIAGCDSPAAPGGGTGPLKAYFTRPSIAPDSDPPFVELVGQMQASCVTDAHNSILLVTIQPTRFAGLLHEKLSFHMPRPGWGMHLLDVALLQGNILDVLGTEAAHWPPPN
jgi:hypothetical protein